MMNDKTATVGAATAKKPLQKQWTQGLKHKSLSKNSSPKTLVTTTPPSSSGKVPKSGVSSSNNSSNSSKTGGGGGGPPVLTNASSSHMQIKLAHPAIILHQ